MKKKYLLISLFLIGIGIGFYSSFYLEKINKKNIDYDYICAIETKKWTDCKDGEWVDINRGKREKVSSIGAVVPPESRLYKGKKEKISTLKYGNTKNGCNNKLLFSSEKNGILKLRNDKNKIIQEIDLRHKGIISLNNGKQVKFTPKEISSCSKVESLENFNQVKRKR